MSLKDAETVRVKDEPEWEDNSTQTLQIEHEVKVERGSETTTLTSPYTEHKVKEEPESEAGALAGHIKYEVKVEWGQASEGVSTAAAEAGLYTGHTIKRELVVGPEEIHKPKQLIANQAQSNNDDGDGNDAAGDNDSESDGLDDPFDEMEETHRCEICHRTFNTKKTLEGHCKRVHKNGENVEVNLECVECKKVYDNKRALQGHMRKVHPTIIQRRDTRYKDYIKVLLGDEPRKKTFGCQLCNFESENLCKTNDHVYRHVRDITCPVCSEIIPDPKLLETHKTQCLFCKPCQRQFANICDLHKHKKYAHKFFKCSFCTQHVTEKSIKKHMNESHTDKLHTCGVCGFKSKNKGEIVRHQKRVHLKEKNATCDICQLQFYGVLDLKKHLVSHKPDKPFKCGFCKKQFARKTTCTTHEKIHTGKKDKICAICGAGFVQKASLNYHMVKHHPDRV